MMLTLICAEPRSSFKQLCFSQSKLLTVSPLKKSLHFLKFMLLLLNGGLGVSAGVLVFSQSELKHVAAGRAATVACQTAQGFKSTQPSAAATARKMRGKKMASRPTLQGRQLGREGHVDTSTSAPAGCSAAGSGRCTARPMQLMSAPSQRVLHRALALALALAGPVPEKRLVQMGLLLWQAILSQPCQQRCLVASTAQS